MINTKFAPHLGANNWDWVWFIWVWKGIHPTSRRFNFNFCEKKKDLLHPTGQACWAYGLLDKERNVLFLWSYSETGEGGKTKEAWQKGEKIVRSRKRLACETNHTPLHGSVKWKMIPKVSLSYVLLSLVSFLFSTLTPKYFSASKELSFLPSQLLVFFKFSSLFLHKCQNFKHYIFCALYYLTLDNDFPVTVTQAVG